MAVPGLYWSDAGSIGPVQARYWQLTACLQGGSLIGHWKHEHFSFGPIVTRRCFYLNLSQIILTYVLFFGVYYFQPLQQEPNELNFE